MNRRVAAKAGRQERGLGRGLAVLLGEQSWPEESVAGKAVRQVPIEFLSPNPNQPRCKFPQEELRALADSIRQKGLLQPILVRPKGNSGRFEIIAGERRWRAAQMSGLHRVPIFERDMSDTEALECALVENIQRNDLDPMEEARGYQQLMDRFGHSQETLARQLSRSRAHVANMLRLQKLPGSIQEMLSQGRLGVGHARALIGRADAEILAAKIVKHGLNVRQVEELTAMQGARHSAASGKKTAPKNKAADTKRLERSLSASLGLRVAIKQGARESGRLVVSYRSLEQLDDICARLMRSSSNAGTAQRLEKRAKNAI